MIKGKLNKAIKATKAFQEYKKPKTKMRKYKWNLAILGVFINCICSLILLPMLKITGYVSYIFITSIVVMLLVWHFSKYN